MATTIRKDVWTTYSTTGYTHDVANDQRSAGGVHHHEIRHRGGVWQTRIRQSNGRFTTFSPVVEVDAEDGEKLFAKAKQEWSK